MEVGQLDNASCMHVLGLRKAYLIFRLRPMPTASLAAITLKPVRGALNSVACSRHAPSSRPHHAPGSQDVRTQDNA